jgi:hypothetical protein
VCAAQRRIRRTDEPEGQWGSPHGGSLQQARASRALGRDRGLYGCAGVQSPFSVGAEQREWLRADLAKVAASTPTLVFSHSPLYKLYRPWNFWTDDADEVQALLRRQKNVTVLHGHTHQLLTNRIGNISFHGFLSTAWPWPYAPEGLASTHHPDGAPRSLQPERRLRRWRSDRSSGWLGRHRLQPVEPQPGHHHQDVHGQPRQPTETSAAQPGELLRENVMGPSTLRSARAPEGADRIIAAPRGSLRHPPHRLQTGQVLAVALALGLLACERKPVPEATTTASEPASKSGRATPPPSAAGNTVEVTLCVALWKDETERVALAGSEVFHSADKLGSTVAVSCDMCHPHAANTHPETYPKFQVQLGRVALLRDMINWCIQHPVRGPPFADDDPRMRALESYILAQRRGKALEYGKH